MRRLSAALALIAAAAAFLSASAAASGDSISWWGGTYSLGNGEHVELHVSTRYPQTAELAQRWVDFFGGLPHGRELSQVEVYVAPLDEVEEMCFGGEVLGCYFGHTIVTLGDSSAGYEPFRIAAHEYGHHIAASRNNAPWRAIDWGTKRWATQMNICSRATAGSVYPGNEGWFYSLNPGEGFAEAYRVLVETGGSAVGYVCTIVDPSFRPTPESLAAIRADGRPWQGPTTTAIRGRFLRRQRTWSTRVATPLDGDLRLRLTVPGGGANDVTLLSGDGRNVLATGSWTGSGDKSIEYRVCGARSVKVRVTRGGAAARFTLQVQVP